MPTVTDPHPPPTPPADEPRDDRRVAPLASATFHGAAVVASCVAIVLATVAFSTDEDGGMRALVEESPFGAVLLPGGETGDPTASSGRRGVRIDGVVPAAPVGTGTAAGTTAAVPAGRPGPGDPTGPGSPEDRARVGVGRGVSTVVAVQGAGTTTPVVPAVGVSAATTPVATADTGGERLLLDDGAEGPPRIVLAGATPGSVGSMTLRVRNLGTTAAPLVLEPTTVRDIAGPLGGVLSRRLLLRVRDEDGGVRASRALTVGQTIPLGAVAPRGSRSWRVELVFPDGGVPPSPTTGDNVFQGAAVDARLLVSERTG